MSIHPVKSIRVKFIHKTFTRARLARRNTARHSWTAAGVLVPGLLLFGAITTSADRLEKHFKVDVHPVITVHNPNGTVIVKAWTKPEVMVTANHLSEQVEIDAEQNGNRIDVTTRQLSDNVAPGDVQADYQINVPVDSELQIHDDSGAVTVANVAGDMNVETVGAGVDLQDDAGYLTVKTIGGPFQCTRCTGRVDVTSISGNFRFIDVHSDNVRAQTSTGNILFDGQFLPNGIYQLKNYSGVIELRFSRGDSFDLSAMSLKGKVSNEAKLSPPSHQHLLSKFGDSLFGTFNSGRAKVDLSSFNGTINIVKRD